MITVCFFPFFALTFMSLFVLLHGYLCPIVSVGVCGCLNIFGIFWENLPV